MMLEIKIDKGVPVPAYSQGMQGYRAVIAKMETGDSCFFENEKQAKGFARAIRDMGFKTKMAKVVEDDRRGTRVWKEEAKNA